MIVSIAYYLLKLGLVVGVLILSDDPSDDMENAIFGIVGFGCFFNLCFWIALCYNFEWSFFTMLIWIFCVPAAVAVFVWIGVLVEDHKEKAPVTTAEAEKIKEDYSPVTDGGGAESSSSLEPNVE
jgi:hypothetical protein